MTQMAVTLHTLSERDVSLIEQSLQLAIEALGLQLEAQNILRTGGIVMPRLVRDEMRELLLKIQAAR